MAYQGNYMYQQTYPQPYQDRLLQLQNQYSQSIPQNYTQPQINQGLLWVQGEAGAKSYLVAPNTTVLLMDSETQRFYLKSTDGSGMPNLRTFEYSEVILNNQQAAGENMDDKYVTRTEYNHLKIQYEDIINKLNLLTKQNLEPVMEKGGNKDGESDI